MKEKIFAMWLANALGVASPYVKTLVEKHQNFEEIHGLSEEKYEACGIKPGSPVLARLMNKDIRHFEKNLEFCVHNYFGVIEYTSAEYPKRLKAIKDPPPVLYARGRMIDFDDNVCIGTVGTRSYTDIGWDAVYKIAGGMAASGAVIVTGLATGIDTAATRAALDFSGYSVGILGTGIERIYPSENKKLFEEMYKTGLVLTELSPFANMNGGYFPVRNRIISGLCQAVLIGEGDVKSGAMYTAAHAGEQGRRIFAIPGDINSPESTGVNNLVRDGATPAFSAWDVLEKYAYLYPHRIKRVPESDEITVPEERSKKRVRVFGKSRKLAEKKETMPEPRAYEAPAVSPESKNNEERQARLAAAESLSGNERAVYEAMSFDVERIPDNIAESSGLTTADVLTCLTMLEIQGFCEKKSGGYLKK